MGTENNEADCVAVILAVIIFIGAIIGTASYYLLQFIPQAGMFYLHP